jgi:hypothetical protein
VADNNNHRIRKVTPAGVVSTLAGSGTAGFADGSATTAKFSYPNGVAVDSSGNVYVADRSNNRIRKVTSAGVVTTLAGSATGGSTDGTGTAATFSSPQGVAVDSSGNVYVAENGNKIRKVTSAGVVTTLAGSTSGFADGNGPTAKFSGPNGVAVDSLGNVYVGDTANHRIRKVTPAGDVSTLAGSGAGFANGSGTTAQFNKPYGVAVDSSGNVYVADETNHRLRKLTLSISGAWAFATPSTIPNVGTSTQSVVFTPTDTTNYNTATTSVSVTAVLDPSGDEDGDGLTNQQEFQLGTNPNLADTDGDGIGDGVEVNTLGTSPIISHLPGNLLTKQASSTGFVATWGIVTGATGYEVEVSTEPSFTSGLIGGDRTVSLGTITSLGITGISNQIRYYRVRSVLPSPGGPVKTAWSPAVSAPDRSAFGKYATLNATGNADSFQAAVGSSANNNSYTISFWMRPDQLGGVSGSENVQVFRQPINNDASAANVDIDLLPDGSLVFGQRSEVGEEHFVSAPADTVLPGNWVHVTAVRDAANAALRLYINGVEIAFKTLAFGTNTWNIVNSGGPGAIQAALNNDSNTNRIRAAFDDVRIYRAVRTPAQILEGMSMPLSKTDSNGAANTSLVFYAPLEGTSLSSTDTNSFYKGSLNGIGSGTITSQAVLMTPTLTWTPSPINLVAPAVLSANELTATASVSGSWSYLPAAGTSLAVGTNQVVGTFVPTDLAAYSVATITNSIIVTQQSGGGTGGNPNSETDFAYTTDGALVTITGYTGTGGDVVIPATIGGLPVTQIGNEAFKGKTSITGITFPDSVLKIGDGAFYHCEYLATVSFGSGVTTIGDWAFGHCYRLKSISIPNSVTSLGNGSLSDCIELESVVLGNQVPSLGRYTFTNDYQLTSITLPASVASIGEQAFSHCRKLAIVNFQQSIPPLVNPDSFMDVASGAKGYYPTTASTAWRSVTTFSDLTLVHPDTESPVITLIGSNPLEIYQGATFSDPGATVTDNKDATRTITGTGTVNAATVGIYTLTYTAQDLAGNLALPVTRTVNVVLDPAGDEDGDGLTNGAEMSGGTNPYQKDSDNDGVNDSKEVADGTNPTDASSYNGLSQGLVAYYPFSGNANDSSGNGNSGIPISPVLSTDRLGASNAAYTFNGTSDRIDLANSAALNMNNGVPFSMSAWIKTDFNDGQRVILGKAAGASGNTPALFVDSEGKLRFDNYYINEVHSSTTVRTGTWTHVAVTYDGSTYRLYVNGLADGEKAFTGSNESGNSWTFSIGGSLNTIFPSGMFKGSIDEVQFWSRTLSPTEVAGVVQASSATANRAPVIAGQSTTYDALAEFTAGPTQQSANSRWQYFGGNVSALTLLGSWKTTGNEVIQNQPQWDGNSGYLYNYPFVQRIDSATGPVPAGSLVIHPSNLEEPSRAVAIGWKNTSVGTVAVNFHVNLRLPYGSNDGIDYYLQRGLAGSSRYLSIRSGSLGNGGSVALASDALLEMRPGEMLYLIVDSKNNFYADHTEVSTFTVTVVEAVNLDSISEGVASANNSGTAVTVLTATSSDADSAALKGIAVTGVGTTHGSWEYTTDGGNIWNSLSGVSLGSARLLKSDELHRVRFVPNANFSGNAEIRYRSWDQTSGEDGGVADLTVAGGGAWVLVAYGANASLGGFLTAPSGSFSSSARTGSAVLPGSLDILKNSSELAMTWTASGGSFPSGGTGSYTHGIAFALPNAAAMSFDGSASSPVIYYNGNSYNPLDSSFAVGSSSPDQSLVNVRTLVGSPGMPSQMYLRNKTFGAGYGGVYGLVMNDGSNAQLDYGQVPDGQTFKAVYLDHGTGAAQGQGLVMGGSGGAQNSYVPSTMALWARLDPLQVLALNGGNPVSTSGNYLLDGIGTSYVDVIDFDSSGAFSANTAIGTISVYLLEPTPINPFLGLNKLYTQNSTNGPMVGVVQGTNTYTYEGIQYAEASALARIRNIDVMGPGSNSFAFAYLGRTNEVAPGLVGYSGYSNPPVFSTYEEATNRYVDGTYLFQGRNIGYNIVTNAPVVWSNSVTAFPNQAPEIQGQWAAGSLRLADPSGTNTISWEAWSNSSTNSLIRVEIKPSGDISYSPSAQTTLTTVLPADSTNCPVTGLTSNSYYQAQISFIGYQSGTIHSASTQFRIVTGPQNPPSNPQVLGASPLGVLYVASGGDVVGMLASVTDEDNGDVVSVELPPYIAGVSNDNWMFLLEGNQLKLRTSEYYPGFGANNQSSYSIVLRARDSFGLYTDTAYTVVVNKVTPTILTPPTSSTIVYGQTLSSSGLNGGEASVQGAFTWTSPSTAPAVGSSSQSVTFTPNDLANYEAVTTLVGVTVTDPDLPVATEDGFTAKLATGMTTKVTTASLIANDKYSGIPGETRGVTFVSALATSQLGGAIQVKGGWLIYRPPSGIDEGNFDTFTYMVTNGTKTATGTVSVFLVKPDYVAQVAIDRVSGDQVYFSVMPGMTFEVQGTSQLGTSPTWTTIVGPNNGNWTSGADGRLIVTDPAAVGAASRFYQFRWIP